MEASSNIGYPILRGIFPPRKTCPKRHSPVDSAHMQSRTFGRTGQKVSEIGHGTWTMGSMWGPRDDKAALDSLTRSLELGVTFIDTAWVYGNGHSEELIAT